MTGASPSRRTEPAIRASVKPGLAQRERRALPADPRARMGLRTALPQLRRPRSSAPRLAQPLQHHPQPQLAHQPATHQPRS